VVCSDKAIGHGEGDAATAAAYTALLTNTTLTSLKLPGVV